MTDIVSSETKAQIEGARMRSAVSEFLIQRIGGSLNWLIDNMLSVLAKSFLQAGTVAQVATTSTFTYTVPAGGLFVGFVLQNANFGITILGGVNMLICPTTAGNQASYVIVGGGGAVITISNTGGTLTYFTMNSVAV